MSELMPVAWPTIEDAPRDGRTIVGAQPRGQHEWDFAEIRWCDGKFYSAAGEWHPTHWMVAVENNALPLHERPAPLNLGKWGGLR